MFIYVRELGIFTRASLGFDSFVEMWHAAALLLQYKNVFLGNRHKYKYVFFVVLDGR